MKSPFVLSVLLLLILYSHLSIRDIVIYTNLECVEDLKQGVPLYSGFGCAQGFFSYFFMFLIYLIFKGGLLSALKVATFAYSIGMFYLTMLMLGKERKIDYILLALLFFFAFYHAEWSIDFILAQSAFFFTLGYYTLFYTKWKHRLILASVFTTISIYTKTNAMILMPVLLLDMYRHTKSIKELIKFLVVPILTIIALVLIFPNYVTYTIGAGTSQLNNDPNDLINAYLKPNIIAMYIIFLFVLSLYLIVKKKMFWPLYLIVNIIAFGGVLWNKELAANTIPFLLPATPFLILSLNKLAESSKKNVYFIILLILYFSIVKLNFIAVMTRDLTNYIDDTTIAFLPNNLTVFAPHVIELQAKYYNEKDGFYAYDADPIWTKSVGPTVFNKTYEEIVEINKENMRNRILDGNYDLIIISQEQWSEPTFEVVTQLSNEAKFNYSGIIMPRFEEQFCFQCQTWLTLFFKNDSQTSELGNKLHDFYYNKNGLKSICKKSKKLYVKILNIFNQFQSKIVQDIIGCESKSNIDVYDIEYLINKNDKQSNFAKFTYFDFLVFGLLALIFYFRRKEKE